MKITRQIVLFFIYYFMQFFAQAFSYALLITFLANLGYTATQRSLFFVVDAILGMVLQIILGYLCDKHQKIKPYLYVCIVFYMIGTFFLYRTTQMNFMLHMLLVPIVGTMLKLVMSLSDSLTIETSEEVKNNYGVIRLFGSIGWAIGSPITAWVVEKFGYSFIGPAFVVSMGIGWLTIAGIKDVNKVHTSEPLNFSDVRQLLKNKAYVIVVVILFLFFIVDMVQSYSVVDKVWYLGGSERDIGNYWLLAAMMELPVFFFGGKLIRRFGAAKLMIASGFFYAVRYAIFGMATSVTHVFIGGVLQGVTYPLLMISSKIMVDEQSPDNMKTSGQQVAGSIYNCGGALITPVMVGLLEDGLGINPSLYAIAALAMIPTILLVFINRSGKSASR